jgi:hypothetical protein
MWKGISRLVTLLVVSGAGPGNLDGLRAILRESLDSGWPGEGKRCGDRAKDFWSNRAYVSNG